MLGSWCCGKDFGSSGCGGSSGGSEMTSGPSSLEVAVLDVAFGAVEASELTPAEWWLEHYRSGCNPDVCTHSSEAPGPDPFAP